MKQIKIPIGIKLNTIISCILITSFAIILYFATTVFKEDNRNNINSLNANIATANAQKVNSTLKSITNNLISISQIATLSNNSNADLSSLFEKSSIISISIFHKKGNKNVLKKHIVNSSILNSFGLDKKIHRNQLRKVVKNFEDTYKGEISLNTELTSNNLPVLYIGVPFIQNIDEEFKSIIVGAIDQSEIIKMFQDNPLFTTYLLDNTGSVLAHPDNEKIISKTNFSSNPLVKQMLVGSIMTGQMEYIDDNGLEQLGAFSLVGFGGTGVVSEVSKEKAYEATEILIKRSIVASLIVVIFSIIFIYLYSHTITNPIKVLVALTEKISSGIYDIKVHKKSSDEIGNLATSFEKMANGLQERERLKNTFGKFVNKELANQALTGELTLGGERKKVTVLFSDIRGFTTITETMEPEEVLNMLNEYMSVMVDIITKRNGIIDKFVGDAIMAIWGAPVTKEDDAMNATFACLEIRQALKKFNQRRTENNLFELKIGMGLNTGYAIAGNMGSSDKMEYTVLGDTVNLASRIETQTKNLKTDILINQSTYDEVKDRAIVEVCEKIYVKGKNEEIFLYKLIGIKDNFGIEQYYTGNPYLDKQVNDLNIDQNSSEGTDLSKNDQDVPVWFVTFQNEKFGPLTEKNVKLLFSQNEKYYKEAKIFKEGFDSWKPAWSHKSFDRRLINTSKSPKYHVLTTDKNLYIAQDNNRYGPFTLKEIQKLLDKGTIKHNDAIWQDGWTTWHPIYKIENLNRRN